MKNLLFFFALCVLTSCGDTEDDGEDSDDMVTDEPTLASSDEFVIPVNATFEWRLDVLPNNFQTSVDVIDIDAFDATPQLVANLKAQGVTVIAYLSVGSWEDFRPDANQFPEAIKGNRYDGFPDERWIDVRNLALVAPIMEARLDMIKSKGFDGFEPDNINGYQNSTGFSLTAQDAANYSRWLIKEAHERGLSIGQKNAEELIPAMVDEFDWMLAEDAFVENFYQQLEPYTQADKAVFLVEYQDRISKNNFQSRVCPVASNLNYFALWKNRDLTKTTATCN